MSYNLALAVQLVSREFLPRRCVAQSIEVDSVEHRVADRRSRHDACLAIRRLLSASNQGRYQELRQVEMALMHSSAVSAVSYYAVAAYRARSCRTAYHSRQPSNRTQEDT